MECENVNHLSIGESMVFVAEAKKDTIHVITFVVTRVITGWLYTCSTLGTVTFVPERII